MHKRFYWTLTFLLALSITFIADRSFSQQNVSAQIKERWQMQSKKAETAGLAEAFRGITTNGTVQPGLFKIKSSGVSTAPVKKAADEYLASLSAQQRTRTKFPLDDDEWRKWMNQHFYIRQGVSLSEMDEAQRGKAIGLIKASLSARGLKLSEDIMKLNYTLGEINNNDFEQYGDLFYWITIMGEPSATEPWGWQVDGHHLIINYFVMGDQVVMSPAFFGSEPVIAKAGKYKGIEILQLEQKMGLELVRSLDDGQKSKAVLNVSKTGNNNVGEAFKDNVVLDYAGLRVSDMNAAQKKALLALAERYVGNMDNGHAKVRMSEVESHLKDTYFAWIGGTADNSVFYYRVHSPVVLLEFDHQNPANLRHLAANPNVPERSHVHATLRTPNGNDYGKDLLRQHYLLHPHGQN